MQNSHTNNMYTFTLPQSRTQLSTGGEVAGLNPAHSNPLIQIYIRDILSLGAPGACPGYKVVRPVRDHSARIIVHNPDLSTASNINNDDDGHKTNNKRSRY